MRSLNYASRGQSHMLTDCELRAACAHAGGCLRALDVSGAFRLTAMGLAEALAPAAGLTSLAARDATLADDALQAALPQLPRLASLRLSGALFLRGGALPALGTLRALRRLDLAFCGLALGINVASAEAVGGLAALTRLDLAGNGLDDGALLRLAALPALRWLSIAHSPGLTDAGLLEFAERSPAASALRALDLSACAGLGDRAWEALGYMPSLAALGLAHLPALLAQPGMPEAMPAALWRTGRLASLSLAGSCCHPSKLRLLAATCGAGLRTLDLSTGGGGLADLPEGGDDGAAAAAAAAAADETLARPRLVGQPYRRLSARHLALLCEAAEHLHGLRRLSAAGARLPLQACLALLRASPWLQDVDLSGCCLEQSSAGGGPAGSAGTEVLMSSGVRRRLDFHGEAALMAQRMRGAAAGVGTSGGALATAAAFAAALGELAPRLRRLRLGQVSGLTESHLSSLCQLTALTELSLAGGGAACSDAVCCALASLPGLARLDISTGGLGDGGLAALGGCPALAALAAARNRGITPAGVIAFCAGGVGQRGLRELDLSMISVLDDEAAAALAAGCPRLRRLRLSGSGGAASSHVSYLTPAGVRALASLGELRELSLGRCPEAVTDEALAYLATGCPLLARLSLAESSRLTAGGLAASLPRLPALTALDLTCCFGLVDDEMRSMLPGATHANVSLPQGSTCPTGSPFRRRS